jgi:CheY-like chemotaxis protein
MEQDAPDPIRREEELQQAWYDRLMQVSNRFRAAAADCRRLSEESGVDRLHPGDLNRAVQAEKDAREQYMHVLQTFRDLTLYGMHPTENPSNDRSSRITLVDDDESIRDAVTALLKSAGYEVSAYASAEAFLEAETLPNTECIVLDVRMPGMGGIELQRRLRSIQNGVPIIFIAANDDSRTRQLAMSEGAREFLCKPFEADLLIGAIQDALRAPVRLPAS